MKWRGIAVCALATACVDTGEPVRAVEIRVRGAGTAVFTGRNDWAVELTRARLAFGPVTLCPGSSAGEFCENGRAEWIDSVVVDALSDRARRAGDVIGTSGNVSSWMFDYGLVSLLTKPKPYVTEAARQLDGHSVDVAGCARKAGQQICFTLQARVAQNTQTEQGIPVVRVNGSGETFDFGDLTRIEFVFDAARWLAQVDFDDMVRTASCADGCEAIVAATDSQAARAVQTALVAAGRPSLKVTSRQ